MMLLLAALLSSATVHATTAQPTPLSKAFADVQCPKAELIAKSYLTLDTSGLRISDKCIDKTDYPYLNLMTAPRGSEAGVPAKSEAVSESKPYTIDRVENISASHYKVSFRYHLQDQNGVKDVADVLYFDTLRGAFKERMGCALLVKPPVHLAVRQKCGR